MGGGGGKRRKGLVHRKGIQLDAVRNEINVTPLVDVCLVLLIIFMVVTPLLMRGKEVQLPKTEHHTEEKDLKQPVVAIDDKGQLFCDQNPVASLSIMKKCVREMWKKGDAKAQGKVFVKAHELLPYGKVYPLIMAVNELGVTNIDLASVAVQAGPAGGK